MSKRVIVPQKKFHVKKGDEVEVISGAHRGSRGAVLQIVGAKNRVIVEGVNVVKKHQKPTQLSPQGGIEEKEASIHISNVKLIEAKKPEPANKKD